MNQIAKACVKVLSVGLIRVLARVERRAIALSGTGGSRSGGTSSLSVGTIDARPVPFTMSAKGTVTYYVVLAADVAIGADMATVVIHHVPTLLERAREHVNASIDRRATIAGLLAMLLLRLLDQSAALVARHAHQLSILIDAIQQRICR